MCDVREDAVKTRCTAGFMEETERELVYISRRVQNFRRLKSDGSKFRDRHCHTFTATSLLPRQRLRCVFVVQVYQHGAESNHL